MAPARPIYSVKVENLTAGWSYETTHRDAPDPSADVVLSDQFEHVWGFSDDVVPGPMDPATVTFNLAAKSAAVMPSIQTGHVVAVTVTRPTLGTPITYLSFVGRLGDPEVTLVPGTRRPVRVRLVATDFLTDLRARHPDPQSFFYPILAARLTQYAQYVPLNFYYPKVWDTDYDPFLQFSQYEENAAAADFIDAAIATSPINGEVSVVRSTYDTLGPNPDYWDNDHDPNTLVAYWAQLIHLTIPADAVMVQRLVLASPLAVLELDSDAVDQDAMAVLSACHVRIPATARKARENAVNTIIINGYQGDNGEDLTAEPTTRTVAADAASEYGTVSRSVNTQAKLDGNSIDPDDTHTRDVIAPAFLPDPTAILSQWSYDSLDVLPETMTDAELDRYAPMFWPVPPPDTDEVTVRPLIVLDVDPDVLLDPPFISTVITGCTHSINGGQLTIKPRLRSMTLPNAAGSDAVTWAQLAAATNPLDDIAWTTSTPRIDPDITWADLRLASI